MPTYRKYDSDEEKAKVYNHRIHIAEEKNDAWHQKANEHWRRYENQFSATKETAGGHQVNVPQGTSTIDALYSSLTAAEVDIVVTPRGQGTEDQAYLATAALKQEWETCDVQGQSNQATKDSLVARIGFVKVGYEYSEETTSVPRPDEDIQKEIEALVIERDLYVKQGGSEKDLPDLRDVAGGVATEEDVTTVLTDRIVIDYVPWDMMLWDPTAKRVEDVKWWAQKTLLSPDEVKSNPVWREYAARNRQTRQLDDVKATTTIAKELLVGEAIQDDERCVVYEIHDMETGTVCTKLEHAEWLLNEVPGLFTMFTRPVDQSPFVPVILRKTPRRVLGISEMDVMEPTLKEMDLYRSKLGTALERLPLKFVASAGAMSEAGKTAARSQEQGAVIELESGMTPADLQALDIPQLSSELYAMPQRLEQELYDSTGASELVRGLFPDRKRTATETSEVVSAAAARQAEKRIALEDMFLAIAKRMLHLMQMFYEQDRVVRLVDEAGDVEWGWAAEDIVGDFKLEVALTPKESKSWQQRRDDAFAVLNVVGPMTQPGPDGSTPVVVTELLRYVLGEMNIPRRVVHRILNLPEDQQAQVMAQLQTQAQQAQAAQGLTPQPGMVPGPLGPEALAAAANTGGIPPEIIAAAQGNTPVTPEAAEVVSESGGIRL